ncbi:uncharacterized protein CTRU02_206582 [Colletotrichum truncatum]|uniref:Uncharacterized protein n=1 Tax=Colletotrichum truncatum TaxID=5467 RepID=A0ACC3Z7C6_COLTU|nr:uncharacterized protein CTRU02_11951 [Colletotrichum truncatum]KAF6785326.1 hypothetical protein CTRU02_11951 [Colletotrichum truncatum]
MKFATVIATLASGAAAIEWLPVVPLHARQVTSGPKYECHEDCGYAILDAKTEGYCTNQTWTDLFEGCLECALEFNIWQYYSNGVTAAAKKCNLDATPVAAANATSNATTATGANPTGTGSSTSSSTATSTEEANSASLNKPAAFVFGMAVLAASQLL